MKGEAFPSQQWQHMSGASSTPCHTLSSQPPSSVCLSFSLRPAVDCTWIWKAGAGQAAALLQTEKRNGGWGAHVFNEMRSVNGHSLWRGQEERGSFPHFLHSPLLCAPLSHSLSCPPSQLARGFVRRQMIPQMPQPSRPFWLHSPGSHQVRGHHRASEWVSVATVSMAVERVAVFLPGCHGRCSFNYWYGYKKDPLLKKEILLSR